MGAVWVVVGMFNQRKRITSGSLLPILTNHRVLVRESFPYVDIISYYQARSGEKEPFYIMLKVSLVRFQTVPWPRLIRLSQ